VAEPVGPVSLGSTTVGAEDEVAMVALKSGSGVLGFWLWGGAAGGAAVGVNCTVELCMVALGSKGWSGTNNPPSIVQNFWLSSGKGRLHLGQRFMREIRSFEKVQGLTADALKARFEGSQR